MNCSDVLPPRRRPVVDERPEEETVEAWCVEYATTRDPQLRARIVKELEWLVRHCARQMMRRDEPFDDLVQVSFLGLIKALDRFDPSFDVRFRTFASVTILGELRRHYRGTWRVRVPRSLQDRFVAVGSAIDTLTSRLHRTPTAGDVAKHLRISVDEVIEAIAAGSHLSPPSLDSDPGGKVQAASHGALDDLEDAETRADLPRLMARLGQRERKIIYLRFYCDRTQAEIADELGLSQVHVSRLLRDALETMRAAAA